MSKSQNDKKLNSQQPTPEDALDMSVDDKKDTETQGNPTLSDESLKTQPASSDHIDSSNLSHSQENPNKSDDINSTLNIKRPHLPFRRRKEAKDKDKDTNVLDSNDRRLQRMLNNQTDENFSTMSIGERQEVLLLIRGMAERVIMEVGTVYKLGRFEIGAAANDEIDMTPYGAQDRGVSRVHAQLQIIDGVVHITDLKSTNGTFVNTKQLAPHTPTPLRKGDELILGRLAVQVLFR